VKKLKRNSIGIKYSFYTHFDADFVSGHVTLAKETGATIVYGPEAKTGFEALIAKDQQEFKIGAISLTVLHTPGHTMESTTYLLRDENNKDIAIFSGDTLFLGDVGRPDLAQKAADLTQEDLAGILYESLRKKIMPLADDVLVYPAHGAGSACGKKFEQRNSWHTRRTEKNQLRIKSRHDQGGIHQRSYRWPASSSTIFSFKCKNEQGRL